MTGDWTTVARKEFRDAARARSLWALTAVMVVSMTAAVYVVGFVFSAGAENGMTGERLISGMAQQGSFFVTSVVSLLGLMAAYASIVDERSSGSLKILLGLPYSRRDVVLGKLVGRAAVIVAATAAAFGVAVLVVLSYGGVSPVDYVFLAFLTTALGVVYVSVGIAVSAGVRTRSRAAAAAVGVFFFFKFLWDSTAVPRGVVYAVERDAAAVTSPPGWYDYLVALGPNVAYSNVAGGYVDGFGEIETLSVVVLVFWLVVPVVLGYVVFENSDI